VTELGVSLDAFHEAFGCHAAVWQRAGDDGGPLLVHDSSTGAPEPPADVAPLLAGAAAIPLELPAGTVLAVAVPGAQGSWLVVGPAAGGARALDVPLRFLLPLVTHYLQSALEVEHAAKELAERYEEINLLYTISDILGRAVTVEQTATTILAELSDTVGARRASILEHDRVTDTLQAVAALGVAAADVPGIAIDDPTSVSAHVFRSLHPRIVEPGEMPCDAERPYRRGSMLSVPILWTTPAGGEPLGVVNLSDRRSAQTFSAGDQKLVAAIATQIGSAIQNARLVRTSLHQQRLSREMELAHDLTMRLLPSSAVVAPEARVAARVVPAESVGGDFYHLFRVGGNCTGVMIGDVSGHGYQAAIITAMAMSASAIHAQINSDPAATLADVQRSLGDELAKTEMFITAFYGVIDLEAATLRYANTGHPHAFVVGADGAVERLLALDPPLGMVDAGPRGAVRAWRQDSDLLVLFTDGISDALDREGVALGEQVVLDAIAARRHREPDDIVDAVFDLVYAHTGGAALRDDLTLVVVRS
jgi:sigma-B regulation protein RsbU (phosphoserine phosphatase)